MSDKPKAVSFSLGRVVATPGALAALSEAGMAPIDLLARHARGDWGTLTEEDRKANEEALRTGSRLLSAYTISPSQVVWVITEAEIDSDTHVRGGTCLLLPEDY
jgi:hypothetical protein